MEVAAMIDPLLSPKQPTTSLERLALMDRPARPVRRKRAMPARTSKIITAGASATALFSMVAGMGWQSGTSSANSATPPAELPDTTPALTPVLPVAQPATSSAAPGAVLPPVVTLPTLAAPVTTASGGGSQTSSRRHVARAKASGEAQVAHDDQVVRMSCVE